MTLMELEPGNGSRIIRFQSRFNKEHGCARTASSVIAINQDRSCIHHTVSRLVYWIRVGSKSRSPGRCPILEPSHQSIVGALDVKDDPAVIWRMLPLDTTH